MDEPTVRVGTLPMKTDPQPPVPALSGSSLPVGIKPLTPAEAARAAKVSVSLIYQLCAERRLPHYRVGGTGRRGKIVIDEAELIEFLRSCRVDSSDLAEDDGPLRHIR